MGTRRFHIEGTTATVVQETEKFWITDQGHWVRKDTLRTTGDNRLALDISDADAIKDPDVEAQLREVLYPRFVVSISELRGMADSFLQECNEDSIPRALADHAEELNEMITGLYIFLEKAVKDARNPSTSS
jgi:hypothetical protein